MNHELKPVEERAIGTLEDIGLLDKIIKEGKVRAGTSLLDRLSREDNPLAKFRERKRLLEAFWVESVAMTNPEDWVLNRDREGKVEAMIAAEGARKVAQVYQIELRDLSPVVDGMFQPSVSDLGDGIFSLRGSATAHSAGLEQSIVVEIEKRSDEDFTGRSVDAQGHLTKSPSQRSGSWQGDLQSAVLTGLLTKAVRHLCAMGRVPVRDLEAAWKDTGKKVDDCRKGQGWGTSGERTASGLAGEEIHAQVKALSDEVMRVVGGDIDKEKALVKKITSSKTFGGFHSLKQITKEFQVNQAWKNLKASAEYKAAHEPAAEPQRDPGQEG